MALTPPEKNMGIRGGLFNKRIFFSPSVRPIVCNFVRPNICDEYLLEVLIPFSFHEQDPNDTIYNV